MNRGAGWCCYGEEQRLLELSFLLEALPMPWGVGRPLKGYEPCQHRQPRQPVGLGRLFSN